MVVNRPSCQNGGSLAAPHSRLVRKRQLPAARPADHCEAFMLRCSSSPGSQMLWSLKSVYASTHTVPDESGLSRGAGKMSLDRSTLKSRVSPLRRLPGGLNGLGSEYIHPCLSSGSRGM